MGYDAFISYSGSGFRTLSRSVERALIRISGRRRGRPPLRVFRDWSGLRTTEDLWGELAAALHASDRLVVVLSPEAVASGWVDREIREWREQHGPDAPGILLVAADEGWAWAGTDFDRTRSPSVPGELFGTFPREPLVCDVAGSWWWLGLRSRMFRRQMAKLAARLLDVPVETLDADERRHQRLVRWSEASVALLVTGLLVAALVFRSNEQAQEDVAASQQLAGQAVQSIDSRPTASALLAVAAYRRSDNPVTRSALLAELHARRGVQRMYDGTGATVGDRFVDCATYGPDPSVLAFCSGDTLLIARGDAVTPFPVDGAVRDAAFTPDGRSLLVATDHDVSMWDVASGRRGEPILSRPAEDLAAGADGRTVAVRDQDGTVTVAETVGARAVRFRGTFPAGAGYRIGLSADGDALVCSGPGSVTYVDLPTGRRYTRAVQAVGVEAALSPDGDRVAIGTAGGSVQVWTPRTGAAGQPVEAGGPVSAVSFDGSGSMLAWATLSGDVYLADPATLTPLRRMSPSRSGIVSLAFDRSGRFLAAGDVDDHLTSWSLARLPVPDAGSPTDRTTTRMIAMLDAGRIVTNDASGRVLPRDLVRGTTGPPVPSGTDIAGITRSTTARRVAVATLSGTVTVLDDATLGVVARWDTGSELTGVTFAADGRSVVTSTTDGRLESRDVAAPGGPRWRTPPVGRPFVAADTATDGTVVAVTDDGHGFAYDGSGRLISDRQLSRRGVSVRALPSTTRVAVSTVDEGILVWDLRSSEIAARLTAHTDVAAGLAVTDDGSALLSAGQDGLLVVWNTATFTESARLNVGHGISAVAVSPDGRSLVLGDDSSVELLPLDPSAGATALCSLLARPALDGAGPDRPCP